MDSDAVDTGAPGATPYPLANTCIEYAAIAATLVPWDTLRNPLVDLPGVSLSDVSVRFTVGRWHLFASRRTVATGRRDVVHLVSPDTVNWEEAGALDLPSAGGLVTPDLTRDDDGRFQLTATALPATAAGPAEPQVWSSADLSGWEGPVAFHPDIGAGVPSADVTLGHAGVGLLAMATGDGEAGRSRLSVARGGEAGGPWRSVGVELPLRLPRFLRLGEAWHVLGSAGADAAVTLVALTGDEAHLSGWSSWGAPRTLAVPAEPWNAGVTATGASLCDARGIDGFAYLFFAGSDGPDFTAGHGAIGIARSRDLITWEIPGAGPVSRRSSR